ncbi:zinc-dependent metalloprotease [Pararcticibacter amylolyticus]|uniref:Zinc-dependent metalloprotease n=1 Tax=Pararcticibacter amylolyticus TaxID=2173175 RepID=A0A2U2PFM1_9SPHI|nr:zinc-dependent metalloprotease [Pararcticibacter amylolyticus]PWG80124.1 hypothetical protein DDR33_13055 [Pararcticibacter amylolyticus]
MRKISLLLLVVLTTSYGCALFKKKKPAAKPATAQSGSNAASNINRPPAQGPKPYKEVITAKAKTDTGLFKLHKVDERFYFEIADSLLNRDILIVSRISKSAADVRASMLGYAGDQINDNVVRFEKGPSNRIFLRSVSFSERSQDTTGMYSSVLNSNLQPIVAAFDVKAYAQDSVKKSKGSVIDVTDYLNGDNDVFFFHAEVKKMLSLGGLQPDRSYIQEIRSFPMNIEIRTVKTYTRTPSPQMGMMGGSPGGPLTYELNSSMVLLPSKPMQARHFDPRVGYFATGYVDFDSNPQGVKRVSMITRWRLEPKDEDIERYKRGELVEPKKPIIFYIDPATPKKWVPYLVQGVNDWQVAFEKAGFKNAIIAKEAPKDKDWSIDDARHSAIVYKPSDIPNASGPHIHDPRTGEILETHINWYHNVMSLLRNWYLIQTAAVDPRAQKMKFDDELMGQLIRFVSSHEVGHTLGLRHNFGSSSTVPVEKLRDKQWVEANGHTPSIMDYARFNYVAQPEDKIGEKGLFPRIGDYDKWAIEWGYRWFPEYKTTAEEASGLNKWVISQLKNKRLWFGTESDPNDPRCQSEDLGDNAMVASSYGIKNLKRILPNLIQWTREPNEGYDNARSLYSEVVNQYSRYMGHVVKNVGGVYNTPKTVEEAGSVYQNVPYGKQKEAMNFLNAQLFATPSWLINKKLISQTGIDPVNMIRSVQSGTLSRLQNTNTINRLINAEALTGKDAYTVFNLFADLKSGIWSELGKHSSIDVYRRNLQKAYVENLSKLLEAPAPQSMGGMVFRPADPTASDVSSIARAHLINLRSDIKKAIPSFSGMSKYHLQDIDARIGTILNPK